LIRHGIAAAAALLSLLSPAGTLRAQSGFNCLKPPQLSSTLPVDTPISDQDDFNCFGWQEFIALNWKASPAKAGQPDTSAQAAAFGSPSAAGDPPAAVWETYISDSLVFLPNGASPGGFGAAQPLPPACNAAKSKLRLRGRSRDRFPVGYHTLTSISKFTPPLVRSMTRKPTAMAAVAPDTFSSILEAGTNSWLTAQNHQITYYEIRLNEDEYNYITRNKLYDANCQWQAVQTGGAGVLLPSGPTSYGPVGAIEVKAAWLPLTDPSLYSKYLTAKAVLVSPDGSGCQQVVVGLVGLHIIHKTPNAQQLAWATFEHVDNAPDASPAGGSQQSYTYYNPGCDPSTDPYKCAVDTQPPACGSGSNPPCNYAAPMQVVRSHPLPSNVTSLNSYTQNLIRQANPSSVFQYYQLVNVLWPNRNTTITAGAAVPLTDGNAQPPLSQGGLANTTLETYFQTTRICLSCHTYAGISASTSHGATNFASDYSFLFSQAQAPANPPAGECKPGPAMARSSKKIKKP
jgi:hypothetical protein